MCIKALYIYLSKNGVAKGKLFLQLNFLPMLIFENRVSIMMRLASGYKFTHTLSHCILKIDSI